MKVDIVNRLSVVFPPVILQHFLKFPPTVLNVTFLLLLVPAPEPLLAVNTSDRVGPAVLHDEVFPQIGPAGETFIALFARLGFLHFKLSQTLRVILLSVLDQSSLGDETFPTVSAGKVPSLGLLSHVDLQVVRFVEHFPTNFAGPE